LRRLFLQRLAIGRDRLLQPPRPGLTLPELRKCKSEIILRGRPLVRRALTRHFLQRFTIGRDRLLELPRLALTLPKPPERKAEIVLRRWPLSGLSRRAARSNCGITL
jgi:hypothetical protein